MIQGLPFPASPTSFSAVMRRALVIGGTRNLGPDLVAALLERGDSVALLNRGITQGPVPPGIERMRADRSDRRALADVLRGRSFDLVVDTTLYTGADADALVGLLDGQVGRYVVWSTGQVYLVRLELEPPFREEDYDGPLMPEPPHDHDVDHRNWVYGVEKRAAEDVLRDAHDRTGFPFVALRMPMIASERDHYGRIAAYAHRILDGGPILLPEDELPCRHVYGRDVVAATLRAAEPGVPAGTAFNVGQDETLSLTALLQLIAEACDRPLRTVRLPRAMLDRHGLLPACSPFSDRWMSALANARGKRVLGLTYTPPADYVPRVVAAALALPASRVPGYERRPEELGLTVCG
jgi:nucleoside-diphosphate-sugar epimerase